ncbi:MAG: hypothetical protein JNK75_15180 [Betaproteobacteria bacterium]|nr:hypothetical protein [Betaproteobacteria bacterium]
MNRLALLFAATACGTALAQAPAAPAASTAPAAPKHKCEKPEYPGRLAPDRRIKQFNVDLNTFKDCLQKFATDQKAISQVHVDAANAAISEYNDYIMELNKLFDRDPKDAKKDEKK